LKTSADLIGLISHRPNFNPIQYVFNVLFYCHSVLEISRICILLNIINYTSRHARIYKNCRRGQHTICTPKKKKTKKKYFNILPPLNLILILKFPQSPPLNTGLLVGTVTFISSVRYHMYLIFVITDSIKIDKTRRASISVLKD
jgi:hypothetical protein